MSRAAVLATLVALAALPAAASLVAQMPGLDPKAGVRVELSCMLGELPLAGFAPMRIRVSNDAQETRSWDFEFRSQAGFNAGAVISRTTISVEGQSEKLVEFLAPIEPTLTDYSYPNLLVTCAGPGGPARYVWSPGTTSHAGGRRTPTLAVSDELAVPIWSELVADATKQSRNLSGSSFSPALMSADPLAWTGWDLVWISDQKWAAADAAQRRALLDWVKLGGRLVVVTQGAQLQPLPDLAATAAADLGGGSVDRLALPDLNAALRERILAACQVAPSTLANIAENYMRRWPLSDAVPAVKVRTGPILLFVTLFAILIGPVNLIVLARRQRHMHLFWTTPLLALIASLALGLVIIFQDGFGGNGARATFVYLDPEGHQACVWQEQISRTGVLLDRDFTRGSPYFLADLPQFGVEMMNNAMNLQLQGERWSGDWFVSRQVQAQFLTGFQPTRARVRIVPGTAGPSVLSELSVPLERLYHIDAAGVVWQADAVQPGAAQPLQPATRSQFENWLQQCRAQAGPLVEHRLPGPDKRGWFMATAATPSEHVFETLRSVRWQQRILMYHGPTQTEGGS